MPAYLYTCKCGQTFEKFMAIAEYRRKSRCKCGKLAGRDITAEHAGYRHKPGNWPLVSDAMGVHPIDAKAAHEYATKIGIPTDFTPDGRAVFTSAKHRKQYCEAHGFHDRNGGYGDPQRR